MSTFSEEAKRMVLVLPDWKERMVAAMRALPLPGVRCSMSEDDPHVAVVLDALTAVAEFGCDD